MIIELANGYRISDDRSLLNWSFIHRALASTYWASERPPLLTERSWAHRLCFGVYAPGAGNQVGCAAVLTDYTFSAHLADLVIDSDCRGRGLGKALVAAILAHPELAEVERWTLQTADAHGLYARHGFGPMREDGKWMVLTKGT